METATRCEKIEIEERHEPCLSCASFLKIYFKYNSDANVHCFNLVVSLGKKVGPCPCENCLVKPICLKSCHEFSIFYDNMQEIHMDNLK